ncbi:N-acylglucosamine 2-epimerase [Tetrabaena socialis]|uniref:N-acylglucosamine 2-epimerase n=1 Tax=Tetrabaena socialis TaxID=47790 RepID=A0A2J7ZQ68_9CHLO|nr:N-acylglucosamine 2-epimerase [Tetrabaena socialis]|eukprot:PNH02403.1 N-acylglucosamine 2-epimerase [Tetrabaena socialis]
MPTWPFGRLDDIYTFWMNHGPDPEYGGFYGTLDRRGQAVEPTDKSLVQQSRHLWFLSTYFGRFPERRTQRLLEVIKSTRAFLLDHMRDPADGRFYHMAARDGSHGVQHGFDKSLYSNSFAIYGLATHGRILGDAESVAAALRAFKSWDDLAHDAENGGYLETESRPILDQVGAPKTLNTHLHVVEALAPLFQATGDALVQRRLAEVVEAVALKMVGNDDYLTGDYQANYTRFIKQPSDNSSGYDSPVVYGHGIEVLWLVNEALTEAVTVSAASAALIRSRLVAMAERVIREGFDPVNGMLADSGYPGQGPLQSRNAEWWAQAEAVLGLVRLAQYTGNATYLSYVSSALTYIDRYFRDKEYGEWYWSVYRENGTVVDSFSSDGRTYEGTTKGNSWKASYHSGRMVLNLQAWDKEYGEWYWSVYRENGTVVDSFSSDGRTYEGTTKGNSWKASYHSGRMVLNLQISSIAHKARISPHAVHAMVPPKRSLPPPLVLAGCLLLLLAVGQLRPAPGGAAAEGSEGWPAAFSRLLSQADQLLPDMLDDIYTFWMNHGPDPEYGGFYAMLDRRGQAVGPTDKSLVQQSRHLWFLSTYYGRFPERRTQRLLDVIKSTRAFLLDHMRDPADGRFFHMAARNGSHGVQHGFEKNMYSNLFAIFGLATHGRILGDAESVAAALRAFKSWDDLAHDAENGGYLETDSRCDRVPQVCTASRSAVRVPNWQPPTLCMFHATRPILDSSWVVRDEVAAPKTLNIHLHVVEALTALFQATGDALVQRRLAAIVEVVALKMVGDDYYITEHYHANYTRFVEQPSDNSTNKNSSSQLPIILYGPPVVYGHDIEVLWLVTEALAAVTLRLPANASSGAMAQPAAATADATTGGGPAAVWAGPAAVWATVSPASAVLIRSRLVAMAERVIREGFDPTNGMLAGSGYPGQGPSLSRNAEWWAQAEAVLGLVRLAQYTGNATYLSYVSSALTYIDRYFRDKEYGEWFWSVHRENGTVVDTFFSDGKVYEGTTKGSPWKASYHSGRMVLTLQAWLA